MRLRTELTESDRRHLFDAELAAAATGRELRAHTGLGPEPDNAFVAAALANPDAAESVRAKARRGLAIAEALRGAVNHDRALHYEVAVEILTASMAYCSCGGWQAEHASEPDLEAAAHWRRLRRQYWSTLSELRPDDHAAVAGIVRSGGAELVTLRETETTLPQPISDTYRLHPDHHANIFEQEIVPEVLAGFGSSDRRLAVLVTAPPGSGKTTLCRRLRETWPGEHGCAVIDPDVIASYHPHGWHRGVANNPLLDAAVAADVEDWIVIAVRHVLLNRNDVLLEIADDTAGAGEDFAEIFRAAGYQAELRRIDTPPMVAARHAAVRGSWRVGGVALGGMGGTGL
jgi:hypothetical protein